jgi:uncharacterized membrane protein
MHTFGSLFLTIKIYIKEDAMKTFMVFMVLMAMSTITAYAEGNVRYYSSKPKTYSYTSNSSAQGVAEIQANRCSMGHCGGNSGYEGVGFSSSSADAAVRNCCYWGQKTPIEIGVARGRNGWYACVRYK